MINRILSGDLDIDILLSSYFSLSLLVIVEFCDAANLLQPKVHAVTLRFEMEAGEWLLLDSNLKEPRYMGKKEVLLQLMSEAYSVRILEWVNVFILSDPDALYDKKISYN